MALGAAAALLWGVATLALRSGAREAPANAFTFWFVGYNTLLLLVPGAVLLAQGGLSSTAAAAAVAAGCGQAAGTLIYGRALAVGDIVVLAPLVSLEGAIAALLGVLGGEAITGPVGVGLALAVAGALGLGIPPGSSWRSPGAGLAVLTATCYGIVLWLVGSQDNDLTSMMLVLNGSAAILTWAASRPPLRLRRTSRRAHLALVLAAVLNLAGYYAYAGGARGDSLAVTAVLGAQFSVVAVIGGYVVHDERLSPRQLAGLAGLVAGISLVAATA
ncbi:MAG: hypothetical protein IRZ21_04885 [Thermoleophilaceae bacterium]|nr:hypothetical protein [Thermoleophilaceae bacterium]